MSGWFCSIHFLNIFDSALRGTDEGALSGQRYHQTLVGSGGGGLRLRVGCGLSRPYRSRHSCSGLSCFAYVSCGGGECFSSERESCISAIALLDRVAVVEKGEVALELALARGALGVARQLQALRVVQHVEQLVHDLQALVDLRRARELQHDEEVDLLQLDVEEALLAEAALDGRGRRRRRRRDRLAVRDRHVSSSGRHSRATPAPVRG